ncbi:MAG: alpha/beta hydrolase [Saccharospirillaceae bacterium]|nr:alpha/beta hydrolase [Saccharospirillaceae bacterium]
MKQDKVFDTAGGCIAGVEWGDWQNSDAPVVVALHGWLDNAASFDRFAPAVVADGYRLLALDLPGHGHSDWLADGGDYYIWETTTAIVEVLRQLDSKAHLVGHSMGAATAFICAASFPEQVLSVSALDAIGPLSTPPSQVAEQLRKGVEDVIRRKGRGSRTGLYASVEKALEARTAKDPVLSQHCIRPVVERNLTASGDGFSWRTDPRLRHASKVRMTEDMVRGFFNQIVCEVLVIRASHSFIPKSMFDLRLSYLTKKHFVTIDGHHHFHLEESTAVDVAQQVSQFLTEVQL